MTWWCSPVMRNCRRLSTRLPTLSSCNCSVDVQCSVAVHDVPNYDACSSLKAIHRNPAVGHCGYKDVAILLPNSGHFDNCFTFETYTFQIFNELGDIPLRFPLPLQGSGPRPIQSSSGHTQVHTPQWHLDQLQFGCFYRACSCDQQTHTDHAKAVAVGHILCFA